ncbi:uncharacterized protein PITG_06474 [Phytophthora infestans T30-4]|uniref:M96 mating-specific protein family n=1 Tax=Phytophthora infestans (strain T30-4) TaxID=403677 RepID=D0N4X8_PHYIT|nr:uncharacterized protein PITG_06474 [Phytophthora infestans T30-4]EEY69936.1 conserved hypothetical protein [Phytophthora infestans T30-4]|eukprot:XP_002998583.1 conserved hypothetical protein [Phytophthora infestans T30-4]
MSSSSEEDFLLDELSVLAFLADCEMENEAIASAAASTPTECDALATTWSDSCSSVSSPNKPPVKKSWRQRRKDEVLHLREVVKELSAELERLKLAAGVQSTLPNATRTPKTVHQTQVGHKTEASLMWEKIAGRQSTLRQRSEQENAKLREAVTRHLQQAKSLQRAIKRKLREDLTSSSLDFIQRNCLDARGLTPPLDSKQVFDKLLQGMDSVYQGVDAFFEHTGMYTLPCPGRRNNTASSRVSKGVFVEFLDSYALPFDVQQTTNAIWTLEKDRTINDTLCFMQNGRTVFVKRTLIQPVYEDMSISLIETSRQVLKRGDLSTLGPTTVMQTHREATLHGDLTALDVTKYPTLDIGVKNWEDNITKYNNRVEDQLVRAMS